MSWFYHYQPDYLHGFYSFSRSVYVRQNPLLVRVPIPVAALTVVTRRGWWVLTPALSRPMSARRNFWIMIQSRTVLEKFPLPLFCLFVSLCSTFSIVILLLSSGYQLHYSRKDESCGSVNYLHLCNTDEQVPATQQAVIRKKIAKGKGFAGEPSQTELLTES